MRPLKFILLLFLCASALGFSYRGIKKDHWKQLYNGKNLTGWDTWLAPEYDDKGKAIGDTIGLNKDPNHVFSIAQENGENIIHISGNGWGAISTKAEYENYHLQLQFKWGEHIYGQKKGGKKDSGLLYYSTGKFGAEYGSWLRSQEFQIEEGDCGDYWGVDGGAADIPVNKKNDSTYVYNPQGTLTTFNKNVKAGRHCTKNGDAENTTGQWNTLDLYCHGDTSIHVVNGKVMMVLYHNRYMDKGQEMAFAKGKIQLQSEGSEIYYRKVQIQTIDRLPAEMLK